MPTIEVTPYITAAASFAAIIVVTWLVARFASSFVARMLGSGPPTVSALAKRVTVTFIWIIGVLIALEQIGLRIELLILLVGIIAIVSVVANRETLENIASKYYADFYIPFKRGDSIRIHGYVGKVIEINPISTVLISDNEDLISVPNSLFLKEVVVNTTPKAWKEVAIPIMITNNIPLPIFESEVLRGCNKLKHHLDERFPPILTVKNRGENTTELTLTLMVKEPETKDEIVSTVTKKVAEIQDQMEKNVSQRFPP